MGIRQRSILLVLLLLALCQSPSAAELHPRTVAAFERYVRLTEARLDSSAPFLWVDAIPSRDGTSQREALRRGVLFIEPVETRDGGTAIEVPDGLIHHWIGATFVPGVPLERVLALLQDYDRHGDIYAPHVQRSRLIARSGDRFTAFLRFHQKKVITVVINSEHEARFVRLGPDRVHSRIVSTRMAEVENPGARDEREKPVGRDGGYLWRLNTYWRFLERDGGTYLQCESISLTRGIPIGLGWVVGPFVNSLPREQLEFTLETTRSALSRP